jgi:hypothetical protein
MPRGIPKVPRAKKPTEIPLDAVPARPGKKTYQKKNGLNTKVLAELLVEVAKLL